MKRWSKKDDSGLPATFKRFDLALALLLGICSSAAYDCLGSYGACKLDLLFIVRALVLAGLIFVLFHSLQSVFLRPHSASFADKFVSFFVGSRLRPWQSLLLMASLLLLCWLPYLILLFPGNIYMDTSIQLAMYTHFTESGDTATLNTHHPLFDMFVFGFIVNTVCDITGSYQAGIFVLVSLQAICSALSFSLALIYAYRRWCCSSLVVSMMGAFFTLLPLLPILVCNISKDSFFSWVYILFLTALTDIALSFKKEDSPDRRSIILLYLSSGLLCCTKNFGIYVALGALLAFVFCRKGRIREMLRLALPALLCVILVSGCAFILPKAFGISGGGMQEALSLPFQQTALSLIEHGDDMSQEDKEIISRVIDIDTVKEDYAPQSADGVKGYAPKGSRTDYLLYIKTWVKQGFLYPKEYLNALVSHEAVLLTATPVRQIFDSSWTTSSSTLPEGYNTKSDFNRETSSGVKEFYEWLTGVPILNVLFISFTYAFFIPAFFICSIRSSTKPRVFLPIIIATLVTLAGVMLSPIPANHMEATRYLIPLIYTAPVLIALSSIALQEERSNSN